MNWNYDDPIEDGEYICCLAGCSVPMTLLWHKDNGGWRMPIKLTYAVVDRILLDSENVVCHISMHDIPMPQGW
jgi:hypothetical protein